MAGNLCLVGIVGIMWRLGLAGIVAVSLGLAGGYAAVRHLVETPAATVPDLVTLEIGEALEVSSREGFGLILERREPTTLLDEGHVLAQRPAPGSDAKAGSTVRITVAVRP